MAERGGQPGNQNGVKETRLFGDTLRRAITQDEGKRLRRSVEKLLDQAAEGDLASILALADRLDGKPHQSVDAKLSGGVAIYATPIDEKI